MDENLIYKPKNMAEMKLNKEIIAFHRGCVLVESKELVDPRNMEEKSKRVLISLLQELKRYRYFLSPEVICRMTISDMEISIQIYFHTSTNCIILGKSLNLCIQDFQNK